MTAAPNPMFQLGLDVNARSCLILGGGTEAEEKSSRLLDAGGLVTVVAPEVTPQLAAWAAEGRLKHVARSFEVADLDVGGGVVIVLNTENDDRAREIYDLCIERRILINTYDCVELSVVSMAALVDPGHLRISISTSNASPSLAGRLRRDLERLFDAEFVEYLDLLGQVRSHLKATIVCTEQRRELLRELTADFRLDGTLAYPEGWRRQARALLARHGEAEPATGPQNSM